MGLLDFFKTEKEEEVKKYSQLHYKLQEEYPALSEHDLVVTCCISGLLARVAYVDFKLDPDEVKAIYHVLQDWKFTETINTEHVAQIAIKYIKEMAGLENHLYVHPLKEHLTQDERFKVLKSLFMIAASDGNVEGIESEEIRIITKGLELSGQHFLVARAEVSEFLGALR